MVTEHNLERLEVRPTPTPYMHMHGHGMTPSGDAVSGNNYGYLFLEFFDAGWSQLAKYTSNVVDASATTAFTSSTILSFSFLANAIQFSYLDLSVIFGDKLLMQLSHHLRRKLS